MQRKYRRLLCSLVLLLGLVFCSSTPALADTDTNLFTTRVEGDTLVITGYLGTGQTVVEVPDAIDGLPVAAVEAGAFWGCSDIMQVVLPASVRQVGSNAFTDCTALERVTAPGLQELGDYVFYNCPALVELTVAGGLRRAGEAALGDGSVEVSTPAADGLDGWARSYTLLKGGNPAARYGSAGDLAVDDETLLLYGMLTTYLDKERSLWDSTPVAAQRGNAQVVSVSLPDYCAQLRSKGLWSLLRNETQARLDALCQEMLVQLEQSVAFLESEVTTS